MKKTILISLGSIILLLVIGVWTYLFIYGTPKNVGEIFATFSSNEDTPVVQVSDTDTTIDVPSADAGPALRQLTTRPVAGAGIIKEEIRYVERGTGHVYSIDLNSGKESFISNTTIPQTVEALFAVDGTRLILTTQRNEKNERIIASLTDSGGALEGVSLPDDVSNVAWSNVGDTVYYLLPTAGGASGFEYDPVSEKSKQLFSIPLRDVRVLWGSPIYVYTTPTARQNGYVYTIDTKNLQHVTTGTPGLMALKYDKGIVVTYYTGGRLESYIPHLDQKLVLPLWNEKCIEAPHKISTLYCATGLTQQNREYPDDWYKGEFSFSDSLWEVDLTTGTNIQLSNFLAESGREIDVSTIGTDATGTYIYFVNKNDGTLWLFDTTRV